MSSRLQDDGGFTFDENRQEFAGSGSYASQWGTEHKVPDATPLSVDQFRDQNAAHLAQKDKFLGGWRSDDHGGDFLDVTTRFNTPGEAQEYGRQNAQFAAFNLDTMKELPIDYGASSLPKGTPDTLRSEYDELGRSAVDAQQHGRADPSQARERGAAIADKLIQQETLQKMGQHYATDTRAKPDTVVAQVADRMRR